MAQENFYDILVKEIKAEIYAELKTQFETQETQKTFSLKPDLPLAHMIETKIFANKKNTYKARPRTRETPSEKFNRELTDQERIHFEIFIKLGAQLGAAFTERELKREYRKLARTYHPDSQFSLDASQVQNSVEKFELAKFCYDKLCKTLIA